MKNLITIGLPSKGRLKEGSISFFEKNNLKIEIPKNFYSALNEMHKEKERLSKKIKK